MIPFRIARDPRTGEDYVPVPWKGAELTGQPVYHKGTGFTEAERDELGLRGLLPPEPFSLEQQVERVYAQLRAKTSPIDKYIYLAGLQDRNETLFYRLLLEHLEEIMPIVYTPTVGEACQKFSAILRRPRGIWLNPDDVDRAEEVLRNAPFEDVRVIVVTDNSRILGLGDQGAGGMGIPIGKLTLYCAGAGIHPARTLPVSLDVGTDNEDLLKDPLYIGRRHRRLRGAEYDKVVDAFARAARRVFPSALVQWEDFKKENAFNILERYREQLPTFNDDIQGTAAVVHTGILNALKITGERLAGQRFALLGAGAAGVGIAQQLEAALIEEGLSAADARERLFLCDSRGLLVAGRGDIEPYKRPFVREKRQLKGWKSANPSAVTVLDVVQNTRPTVLIGTSGQPGAFDRKLAAAMAAGCRRPLIMPLSNPTSLCEASPADLMAWTGGRALIGTGSPFDDVKAAGRRIRIGQANNVLIFPGVGLGILVAGARRVSNRCFLAAARALADATPASDIAAGCLFPRFSKLRDISQAVAAAVVKAAVDAGDAPPMADAEIPGKVAAAMWYPRYLPYRYEPGAPRGPGKAARKHPHRNALAAQR